MAKILETIRRPEGVRAAAQETIQAAQEQSAQHQSFLETALAEINNIDPELGGFEGIAALLVLPDEQFAFLSPVFLNEIEKTFTNVNTQLSLVQMMNVAGVKLEDIQQEYLTICQEIDEQLGEALTHPKRDFLKRLLGLTYNALSEANGIAKKEISISIEYCREGAKMPTYAHTTDAGMDVYALEDITIAPGETKLIPLGIKVALPRGYELQIRPKSGRSLNTKLRIANTPATIDAGYRDEIGVIVENIEQFIKGGEIDEEGKLTNILFGSSYTIGKGEKFAQLVLNEVPKAIFNEVESVANVGENRGGGFGSTGLR